MIFFHLSSWSPSSRQSNSVHGNNIISALSGIGQVSLPDLLSARSEEPVNAAIKTVQALAVSGRSVVAPRRNGSALRLVRMLPENAGSVPGSRRTLIVAVSGRRRPPRSGAGEGTRNRFFLQCKRKNHSASSPSWKKLHACHRNGPAGGHVKDPGLAGITIGIWELSSRFQGVGWAVWPVFAQAAASVVMPRAAANASSSFRPATRCR